MDQGVYQVPRANADFPEGQQTAYFYRLSLGTGVEYKEWAAETLCSNINYGRGPKSVL